MHVEADDLVAALRRNGLRVTRARRTVCEVIAASHAEHLDAGRIYDLARSEFGTELDRSTVYRTLDVLEQTGVIRHAHLGDSAVYHLADERRHQHLICHRCGATAALPSTELADFVATVKQSTGFAADVEHFAVSGLCADCAASVR